MNAARLKTNRGQTTLVDDDIALKIQGKPLYSHCRGYIFLNDEGHLKYLHRWIMKAKKGQIVDHISGNKSDNRRENLRIVTSRENQGNRQSTNAVSGYRGVSLFNDRKNRKWRVSLKCQRYYRKNFFSIYVAALCADQTLRQIWAVPGYLNYPASIPSEHVTEIMDHSMGSWMKIVFSKKSDGRQRVMVCRIMAADQPPPPKKWKGHHSDLYFVWEKDVGIKAIAKERILCLEIYGIKYAVTRSRFDMQQ